MKKRMIALVVLVVMCLSLVACSGGGSGDVLKGTWSGKQVVPEGYESMAFDNTFVFDGNGGCSYKNDYASESKGTYVIEGAQVTITLESWDAPKVYDFAVNGDKLDLTATDAISPSYEGLQKQ